MISPRSSGNPAINGPSFRTLIAAKDASILAHLSHADSAQEMAPEIGGP